MRKGRRAADYKFVSQYVSERAKEEERVRALNQDEALVVVHRLHHSHNAKCQVKSVPYRVNDRGQTGLDNKPIVRGEFSAFPADLRMRARGLPFRHRPW